MDIAKIQRKGIMEIMQNKNKDVWNDDDNYRSDDIEIAKIGYDIKTAVLRIIKTENN